MPTRLAPSLFAAASLAVASLGTVAGQTPLERHGALRVQGNQLVDECGRVTQLRGMSFFWHQWQGDQMWNGDVVEWLRDDWRLDIVRAPLGTGSNDPDDYLRNPAHGEALVRQLADAAIAEGLYVILDFHAHPNRRREAVEFFSKMAREYGEHPNVIYEIWNEPVGTQNATGAMWAEITSYTRDVVSAIRAHDPDNLIIAPTPFYCLYPDVAAADPVRYDAAGDTIDNLAYTLHFYAGEHKATVRERATRALDAGICLFVTECGRVDNQWGPNNPLDTASWNEWIGWVDDHRLSYLKWSLSTKNERSSSLRPTANPAGGWTEAELTPEGQWNRTHFRSRNAERVAACATSSARTPRADATGSLTLAPNPVTPRTQWLRASLRLRAAGPTELTIIGATGQVKTTLRRDLHAGDNSVDLPVADLTPGTYFVTARQRGDREVSSTHFVVAP